MNTNKKLIALTTATLIALAPVSANAFSMSDGVFSWPTEYKNEKASTATSTFDGNVKNLEIKKETSDKTKNTKRK